METVLFPDDLSLFMVLMGRVCDNIVPFRVSNTLEGVEIFLPPPPSIDFYAHILRNKKIYNFDEKEKKKNNEERNHAPPETCIHVYSLTTVLLHARTYLSRP